MLFLATVIRRWMRSSMSSHAAYPSTTFLANIYSLFWVGRNFRTAGVPWSLAGLPARVCHCQRQLRIRPHARPWRLTAFNAATVPASRPGEGITSFLPYFCPYRRQLRIRPHAQPWRLTAFNAATVPASRPGEGGYSSSPCSCPYRRRLWIRPHTLSTALSRLKRLCNISL
jgi:hypothetical protein